MDDVPLMSSRDSSVAGKASDLRVTGVRALRGPNLWGRTPVLVAELRVEALATTAPSEIPGFAGRLSELLPAPRASDWGSLLVEVVQELQRRAGSLNQRCKVTGPSSRGDGWMVAVGYEDEEVARTALREAARILRDCIRGDDMELDTTVAELADLRDRGQADVATLNVISEARARGIAVRRDIEDGAIQLGLGATSHRLPVLAMGDTAVALLDRLYPRGAATRIPVIAITGTNGKTTTTRLTAHIFRSTGKRVGYTTTDGIYFKDDLLMEGDFTGPFAANVILSHRSVDVAVLETARGGILRSGLGYDECDVGVVTNVTSDHLGLRDIHTIEQLADVKAVIPSVVRADGYAVLNADDRLVHPMRARTDGAVAFFSTAPPGTNPVVEQHLAEGGTVARVERLEGADQFVVREGDDVTAVAPVADVPLTFGGMARFQYGNVLCAVLAAHLSGVPIALIRAALMTFVPSAEHTPGRLNVVETDRGTIILDYAHNAAAVRGLLEFVALMPATRRIALLTAPGDRRDEDLREVGQLAQSMDLVVLKEHPHYRRGRAPGEVSRIITEGLLATGFPAARARTFTEEHDAVRDLLDGMRPGDVVAIVADDLPAVLEQIQPYRSHQR